ncbi:hypothetical protein VKT23_003506 [Stygiomarasmius scandens]|uniref:Uncharacterized protein n=1 Tax=Marasmiellus scandens TaxID=2682957 RepID=A0ABR1K0G2_9AGAR
MASRAPRQLFSSLRATARPARGFNNAFRGASRRGMSSSAESTTKKSSDMPWIIGSALVFAPAFLYLVSPASRKTAPHAQHHDKHEKHEEHAPVTMKDDEGKEADVTESMKKAESEDVPKAEQPASEEKKDSKEEQPKQKVAADPSEAKKDHEPVPKDPAGDKEEDGPTEQSIPEKASVEGEAPKTVDEKVEDKKDS